MFRFTVFCLCASFIWALPSTKTHSKVFSLKSKGPRIVNGNIAKSGQFPWQAALFIEGDEYSWFCGGSIISEQWILTAGHCVDGAQYGEVLTGSTDVYGGHVSDAIEAVLHEEFDGGLLANDIAVLKIENPLRFDANTTAINLSSKPLDADINITVSGWGLTGDGQDTISETLNFVSLVTISQNECGDTYGPDLIRDEMVCATSDSNEFKSTCSGDSGGPVVTNANSNPVHVAVVSFVSDAGCERGAPSGYTRTAYYRDWIKNQTGV